MSPRPTACRTAWLATALMVLGAPAWPQEFIVATGPAGNTYDKMFADLTAQCQMDVHALFIGKESSGSVENISRLLNNQVTAAVVQLDVLHFKARAEDMSQIKVLFPMHVEQVHLVALRPRADAWARALDWLGAWWGRKPLTELAQLRHRKVAAWGGSVVTAQNISLQASVPFEVVALADQASATKALLEGSVAAVVAVGGAPLKWAETLDSRFGLLAIGAAETALLKEHYRQARISYINLGQADGKSVDTVATSAVLVTRNYRTPALACMLDSVRACVQRHLPDLQGTGNHKSWWLVDLAVEPQWPRYEPPPTAGACPAANAPAVPPAPIRRRARAMLERTRH